MRVSSQHASFMWSGPLKWCPPSSIFCLGVEEVIRYVWPQGAVGLIPFLGPPSWPAWFIQQDQLVGSVIGQAPYHNTNGGLCRRGKRTISSALRRWECVLLGA